MSTIPTLLLVDDDKSVRRYAHTIISKTLQCHLLEAKDGKEALAITHNQTVDLVLLDLVMPELDGFEVAAQLKQAGIPFIAMTALIDQETIQRLIGLGSFSFLAKPVSEAQLIGTVLSALSHIKHIKAVQAHADRVEDICIAKGAIAAYLSIHPDQAFDVINEMGRDQQGNAKDSATIVNDFLIFMAKANQKFQTQQQRNNGKKR